MTATDGTFDETFEDVSASFTAPTVAGVYDVCVRGTDAASNTGAAECASIAVYDPSAGYATGAGWIPSPAGAFADDPTLTGKAMFAFISKYAKGANTPDGNTEFRFRVAGLHFQSTGYDFLIVNQGGTNAQFKGSGTINCATAPDGSAFRFMIWAKDGDPDTFRIKIWWDDAGTEHVVYDNGVQQPIGGGAITIHQ
jgi:hypothetical protein